MQGDLPAEFKRLQQETKQLLEEFQAYNKICFEFVDPLKTKTPAWTILKTCIEKGLHQ
jgi:hypothetical protein